MNIFHLQGGGFTAHNLPSKGFQTKFTMSKACTFDVKDQITGESIKTI